jgi:segregation and condensation protein A
MNYKIRLDIFEGPLDLLLYLIRKNDLDITEVAISEVTEQYLSYIDMMKMLDLDVVGDFLVMAATLMQIKSRVLLPRDPEGIQSANEDPRDELVRRLNEYKRFKEIAEDLQEKELVRRDLFSRSVCEEDRQKIREDSREVVVDSSLFDLISALSEALRKAPDNTVHEIAKEEYTVEQKIHDILHRLLDRDGLVLQQLFREAGSRSEMIVTFLAVLELIRLKEVKVVQLQSFGDIEILRNKENMQPLPAEGSYE